MIGNSKRFLAIPAVAVCLLAVGLAGSNAAFGAQQKAPPALPSRITPQAQKLLNRTIQALGGAAFLHYKTVTTTGSVFAIAYGQAAGYAPFKSTFEPPDKRRFSYGKGKPVILINNGNQGWELDRLGRTHQNPDQMWGWKIANRYSLDNLLRYLITAPGVLILTHGVDFVDNQPVDVVDIIDAQNVHVRLYIHRSTYLPVRVTYRVRNPNTQDWEDYADDYSDYQMFQGINTPMHIARYLDGERIGELFRNSVRYNETIPSDYFARPQ
ncbi:MAG: outer membrane lipoprotein-sorting protein [Acidobacteria bacterium]|nr:outer membrane lipoprotein-sorting protein [Acidobacteriota bacterium]